MLEQAKNKHVVAPGINWLIATLHDAEAVGVEYLRTVAFSDLDSSDTPTRRLSKLDTRRSSKRPSGACVRCIVVGLSSSQEGKPTSYTRHASY